MTTIHFLTNEQDKRDHLRLWTSEVNRALASRGCIGDMDRMEQCIDICACEAAQAIGLRCEVASRAYICRDASIPDHFYPQGLNA